MIHPLRIVPSCALLLALASSAYTVAQSVPPQAPAGHSIQIYLTASGRKSAAAALDQTELRALIDKQPAQIASLRAAKDDKLTFALLIDTSSSDTSRAEQIREAATQVFEGFSAGGNQGYLVVFNTGVALIKVPLGPSAAASIIHRVQFGGGTALYDAIGETCTQLLSRSKNPDFPRRVIILITDGDDNQSQITLKKSQDIANQEGIAVFSLAPHLNETNGEDILKKISKSTGGQTIVADTLNEGVASLFAAIDEQWVVSLVPQKAPDQKLHTLMIATTQHGVSLSVPAKILLH